MEGVIRYGDYIIIRHPKPMEGFLSADGFLSGDTYLQKAEEDMDSLTDCVWEVHVQNQYSAVKEYENALLFGVVLPTSDQLDRIREDNQQIQRTTKVMNMMKSESDRKAEILNNLKQAAINEQRLNEKMMSLKVGKVLAFGDLIQLRHVKSNKFLTVNAYTLAKSERENLRVLLQSRGDSCSGLIFMPRFKNDREGQAITNSVECIIRVHERVGEFIHLAKRVSADSRVEVNCSLENSFWIVTSYRPAKLHRGILGGQIISLQDPDSSSFVTLQSSIPGVTERTKIIMSTQQPLNGANSYAHSVGTSLLWLLEKHELTDGGPVSLQTDLFTLRSINTGLFFRMDPIDGVVAARSRKEASRLKCICASADFGVLKDDQAVQLSIHDDQFVSTCVESYVAEGESDRNRDSRAGLSIKRLDTTTDKFSAASFMVSSSLAGAIGSDMNMCIQAAFTLRRFERLTRDMRNGVETIATVNGAVKPVFALLDIVHKFLSQQSDNFIEEIDVLLEPSNTETIVIRQRMALEQGLLDVILDIIEHCGARVYDKLKPRVDRARGNVDASSVVNQKMHHKNIGSMKTPAVKFKTIMEEKKSSSNHSDESAGDEGNDDADEDDDDEQSGSQESDANEEDDHFDSGEHRQDQHHHHKHSRGQKVVRKTLKVTMANSSGRTAQSADFLGLGQNEQTNSFKQNLSMLSGRGLRRVTPGSQKSGGRAGVTPTKPGTASSTMSQEIAQSCFRVLLAVIKHNHENQLHVSDRLATILKQIRYQDLAVECVRELLSDNITILQTKVRETEINIFVRLLVEFEVSVTFIRLLQSTCSCPMGVDSTQRMIAKALFGSSEGRTHSDNDSDDSEANEDYNKPVIISLHSEFIDDALTRVDWDISDSIYLPSDPSKWKHVSGHKLLTDGYPRIFASWKHFEDEDSDFSMLHLFNTNSMVSLEELCNPKKGRADKTIIIGEFANHTRKSIRDSKGVRKLSTAKSTGDLLKKKRNSRLVRTTVVIKRLKASNNLNQANSAYDRKCQIRDFLVAQLYLMADLCLDRNYVSIGILEPLLDFETLMSILLGTNIQTQVKAAVCRIIRCMYVDREPQVKAIYPRLVRTAHGEHSVDEGHTESKFLAFALLQQIIGEYVRLQLTSVMWDELSAEMMDLLVALVEFGFYDPTPLLKDIFIPLVKSVDERRRRDVSETVRPTLADAAAFESDNIMSASLEVETEEAAEQRMVAEEEEDAEITLSSRLRALSQFVLGSIDTSQSWQHTWLQVTNKIFYLLSVFAIVAVTVIVVLVQLLVKFDTAAHQQFFAFDIATCIFFGIELFLRLHCFAWVKGKIYPFFKDFYNTIDSVLVVLDVAILCIEGLFTSNVHGAAKLSRGIRAIRAIRFLRLLRILRAARLLKRISEATNAAINRAVPIKYSKISQSEVKTMIGILRTMSMLYDRIQDKNIGTIIHAFSIWVDQFKDGANTEAHSALHIYEQCCHGEVDVALSIPSGLDEVLLDNLMYSDANLVQESLQLLMVHKSRVPKQLEVAASVQLLYSAQEGKYRDMTMLLMSLKQYTEKFEIWGELESHAHFADAARVKEILESLIRLIRLPCDNTTLSITSEFEVDAEIQTVLLNLNILPILISLQETLFDGGRETPKTEIIEILQTSNDLLCWIVSGSEANQELLFDHFSWFVEKISDSVHSSKVIEAILQGNSRLIKNCPKSYISDMVELISTKGCHSDYLDLFVGMTVLAKKKNARVLSAEREICRFITGPEWKRKLLLWCSPYGSKEHNARAAAMSAVDKSKTVLCEHLQPQLQYHIKLLQVLASCNLGPKLQALYPFEDILCSMLDDGVLVPVRIALGNLFLEMIACGIDMVEYAEASWRLIDFFAVELKALEQVLPPLFRSHVYTHVERLQYGEWIEIMLNIIIRFFSDFEINQFDDNRVDGEAHDLHFKTTSRGTTEIMDSVENLFFSMKNLLAIDRHYLGKKLRHLTTVASEVILSHTTGLTINDLAPARANRKLDGARKLDLSTVNDMHRLKYRSYYSEFISAIIESKKHIGMYDSMVALLEKIPMISHNVEADVRFEHLIRKLASHIRGRLKRNSSTRTMDKKFVESFVWLLRSFRCLLESHLEMSVAEDGSVPKNFTRSKSVKLESYRAIFNDAGVTFMCLDLIASGIQSALVVEAMRLLVVLLWDKGGNLVIETSVLTYLRDTDSILFFEYIKECVDHLAHWTTSGADVGRNENNTSYLKPTERGDVEDTSEIKSSQLSAVNLPPEFVVFTLLGLMCEGDFKANKNILREQTGNSRVTNVLGSLASFVDQVSREELTLQSIHVISIALATIFKVSRGPCAGNQEQFVIHSDLVVSLNRLMRQAKPLHSSYLDPEAIEPWNLTIQNLREYIIDVLQASIDGRSHDSFVFERVATTVELNIFNAQLLPTIDGSTLDAGEVLAALEESNLTKLQSKYIVFLLCLKGVGESLPAFADAHMKSMAAVEVVGPGGVVETVHFHIPAIIGDIAESSKRNVASDIEAHSHELKLKQFVLNAKKLYADAKHQQFLNFFGFANLWGLKTTLTWVMFGNAVLMNCLILAYYEVIIDDSTLMKHARRHLFDSLADLTASVTKTVSMSNLYHFSSDAASALKILNFIQIILSSTIVFIFIVVRVPVSFLHWRSLGHASVDAATRAIRDPVLLWYSAYLAFTVLGVTENVLFLSLLLLDLANLDATTRHLLLAVKNPGKQLIATVILLTILLNIFAGFIFYYYRQDIKILSINSMWESFKLGLVFGTRGEYGVSTTLQNTLGHRLVVDIMYYFIILAVMREVFFAIIIDTFGQLREDQNERDIAANNCCFICDTDRHDFELLSAGTSTNGFNEHRNITHNTMHYLYFIISVWEQPEEEDNGMQMHVRKCLQRSDISWFPVGVAIASSRHQTGGHGHGHHHHRTLHFDAASEVKQSVESFSDHANNGSHPPSDSSSSAAYEQIMKLQKRVETYMDQSPASSSAAVASAMTPVAAVVSSTLLEESADLDSDADWYDNTDDYIDDFNDGEVEKLNGQIEAISTAVQMIAARLDALESRRKKMSSASAVAAPISGVHTSPMATAVKKQPDPIPGPPTVTPEESAKKKTPLKARFSASFNAKESINSLFKDFSF